MKIPKMCLAQWSFLLIFLSSCAGQREHPAVKGQTIASLCIRHTTPKLVQDRRLSPLISSKPGSPYSEAKIDDDIKSLWESGLVEDAEFAVKSDGSFVHLVASVSTRRPLGPVLLRGNKAFSDLTLWKQISKPLADRIIRAVTVVYDLATDEPIVHKDERLVGEVLPAVCDELESFYRSKGFQAASVRAEAWNGGPPIINDFGFVIDEHGGKKVTNRLAEVMDVKCPTALQSPSECVSMTR
ncbi:MAG: hypothetical protein J0M04_16640 [Verrucomicrobia bacterium]|nr:hypothetical protein [Verrucomicrobiota bacterium]